MVKRHLKVYHLLPAARMLNGSDPRRTDHLPSLSHLLQEQFGEKLVLKEFGNCAYKSETKPPALKTWSLAYRSI